jgi:hypothetical protein
MAGNLQDRPFLLLLLRVTRTMLALCAAALIIVAGALWYSITAVQGRDLSSLSGGETVGLGLIGVLLVACAVLFAAAGRILRQHMPS